MTKVAMERASLQDLLMPATEPFSAPSIATAMPLKVLEQVDTLVGNTRFLITFIVTAAQLYNVLHGTDFLKGTGALLDSSLQSRGANS